MQLIPATGVVLLPKASGIWNALPSRKKQQKHRISVRKKQAEGETFFIATATYFSHFFEKTCVDHTRNRTFLAKLKSLSLHAFSFLVLKTKDRSHCGGPGQPETGLVESDDVLCFTTQTPHFPTPVSHQSPEHTNINSGFLVNETTQLPRGSDSQKFSEE